MTYLQVGELLNVSESAVGHYLSGRRQMKVRQLKALAEFLNMTLSEMVGDDALFVEETEEKELIELIRSLPEEQRKAALALLRSFTDRDQAKAG